MVNKLSLSVSLNFGTIFLLSSIKQATSLDIFKKDLKTFLFNKDVNFLKFFFTYLFTIYMVNLIYLYLVYGLFN